MQHKRSKTLSHNNIVLTFVNSYVSLINHSNSNKNFLLILSNNAKD